MLLAPSSVIVPINELIPNDDVTKPGGGQERILEKVLDGKFDLLILDNFSTRLAVSRMRTRPAASMTSRASC
jgi:hypothetical protein